MAHNFKIAFINPETLETEVNFIKMSERFYQAFVGCYGKELDVRVFYDLIDNYSNLGSDARYHATPIEKSGKLRFNYIDIRPKDKGLVSYIPGNREQIITPDGKWALDGRQTMKLGRFIKAFFPQVLLDRANIDDRSIEKFSGVVKGQMNCDDFEMRIVDGEDIRTYYHFDNYLDIDMVGGHASSSLHGSCMRDNDAQDWLDPYVNEPGIKLAVMFHKETDKVAARALLWEGVNFMDKLKDDWEPITFMDRIYAYREWMIEYMLDWATEQGYMRKEFQSAGQKEDFINPIGEKVRGKLMYKLVTPGYETFPYMDTMSYTNIDVTELRNDESWSYYALHGTDGNRNVTGYDDDDYGTCQCCGDRTNNEDLRETYEYHGDGVCDSCIDDRYVYSQHYNTYVDIGDVEEYGNDWRFSEDMSTCDYDGERYPDSCMLSVIGEGGRTVFVYEENYVTIREGGDYIMDHSDIVWHGDSCEYVLSENLVECAHTGDEVHIYDAFNFGDEFGWVSEDHKDDFIAEHNLILNESNVWVTTPETV